MKDEAECKSYLYIRILLKQEYDTSTFSIIVQSEQNIVKRISTQQLVKANGSMEILKRRIILALMHTPKKQTTKFNNKLSFCIIGNINKN